ncbi:LamG-like jellyroll fold domain-containing protein [Chryseosolibacter histidini]|uniref:LamG-like jellyroll fold domain-containing protein n=1 Tax=Chryseosolibacter histidini TaxID=2782349 RepID=UPI0020B18AAB|nr:LamG-like jellyroll fold domain-containing protein [Chryseosolibacter histidini]
MYLRVCNTIFLLFVFFSLANCQESTIRVPASKDLDLSPFTEFINNGVVLAEDRFGNKNEAYFFDGKRSNIELIAPDLLPLTGDFTVSFWLRTNSKRRIQAFSSGDLDHGNFDFDIHPVTGIWAYWNGGGDHGIQYDSSNIADDKWHHIAITRAEEIVKMYQDGKFVGEYAYKDPIGSSTALILGGRSAFPFDGYLDDINIYPTSMTGVEIKDIYDEKPFFVFPNQNSVLTAGYFYDILLTSINGSTVDLEVSYNSGASWARVASGLTVQDPLINWQTMSLKSGSRLCKLRLKDENGEVIAQSALFRLNPPTISTDYQWEKVTEDAPWHPRDGAGVTVLGNKAWLMGGWNPSIYPTTTSNELWSSPDGTNWQPAGVAPWEGRHVSGWVNFGNAIWLVGGDANQQRYQTDVWKSTDGVNWTEVISETPWMPRASHMVTVFKGKLWMVGGQEFNNGVLKGDSVFNDVWNSSDGIQWNMVTANAPWEGRGFGGLVSFRGRLWLFGGGKYNYPREYYNDVWSTADGITWTKHVTPPWRARFFHQTVVYDNKVWIIGGYGDNSGNLGDIWYTTDGMRWVQMENVPWSPRHAATAFIFNNNMYLTCGTTGNNPDSLENDIWRMKPYLNVNLPYNHDLILPFGESLNLKIAQSPGYQYSWYKDGTELEGESGPSIDIVEDGEYAVFVRSTNGALKGQSNSIKVLFEPNVSLNVGADTLVYVDKLRIETYYDPEYSYSWYYNNKRVPDMDTSAYEAKLEGHYFVEVTGKNGLVKSSPAIYISFSTELSSTGEPKLMLESRNERYLDIYYFNKPVTGAVSLRLFDMNGREFYRETADKVETIQYFSVNIEHLSAGMFIALIETFNDKRSRKFLKK